MRSRVLLLFALFLTASNARAQVSVDYTVEGTSSAWLLNFRLTNTFDAAVSNQAFYFFGVALGGRDIVASPGTWSASAWHQWTTPTGGVYNNNWITGSHGAERVSPGESLDGFVVRVNEVEAPTTVRWFAYAYDGGASPYYGSDAFQQGANPGFEGVATITNATVTPEPMSMALLGSGLAGLGVLRRRRRKEAEPA